MSGLNSRMDPSMETTGQLIMNNPAVRPRGMSGITKVMLGLHFNNYSKIIYFLLRFSTQKRILNFQRLRPYTGK